MKLNQLLKQYNKVKDIKIIGKEFTAEDKLCEIMGITLSGKELFLLLIEYDQKKMDLEHERELELYYDKPITNRIAEHQHLYQNYHAFSHNLKEVVIDDVVYKCEESNVSRAALSKHESMMILNQYFAQGWKPQDIGKIDTDKSFLCAIRLSGKFNKMPQTKDNPTITFNFQHNIIPHITEIPISLEIGKEYDEKIYFTDKNTGEEQWIYINSVYTYDLLVETMKNFTDPRYKDSFSDKEFSKLKSDTQKQISQMCPPDKRLLCVEYESYLDRQVDFKSAEWLNREAIRSNSCTIFGVKTDTQRGKLGSMLRAAIIDEPVDPDTKFFAAEIFKIYVVIEPYSIVIK